MGGEMPPGRTPPSQERGASERPDQAESSPETNRRIMVDAIAENMWDLGMTHGMEGTPEERKAVAREMAETALALVPTNFERLPTRELNENKSFLVAEAVRLYKESLEPKPDTEDDEESSDVAAK